VLWQNANADLPGCHAYRKGENDRSLITLDKQNSTAQPGTDCQIEFRLIHFNKAFAFSACHQLVSAFDNAVSDVRLTNNARHPAFTLLGTQLLLDQLPGYNPTALAQLFFPSRVINRFRFPVCFKFGNSGMKGGFMPIVKLNDEAACLAWN
jgi:hypothetical protein